jgi:hypothetical protein
MVEGWWTTWTPSLQQYKAMNSISHVAKPTTHGYLK